MTVDSVILAAAIAAGVTLIGTWANRGIQRQQANNEGRKITNEGYRNDTEALRVATEAAQKWADMFGAQSHRTSEMADRHLAEIEKLRGEMESDHKQHAEEFSKLRERIAVNESEITNLQSLIRHKDDEIADLKLKINNLESENLRLVKTLDSLSEDRKDINAYKLRIHELETEVKQLQQLLDQRG